MPSDLLRIVCFISDLDGGGAQRTMINLVKELPGHGIQPHLIVGRADGPLREAVPKKCEFTDLNLARTRQALWPLRAKIRELQPDLVFSTMLASNIIAAGSRLMLARAPKLVLRETNSHRARADLSGLTRRLAGWVYRQADGVVALSEGVRRELIEDYRLSENKVKTIHNPINLEHLKKNNSPAPWKDGAPVVLAAGRLTRQKGFDILLHGFAKSGSNWRLAIIGDGPDKAAIQTLANELGIGSQVMLPGFISDPIPWFKNAELFVLSSRWEGFGHVIVEAMACGTPVIATDCPWGPTDIITHKETGWLVESENTEALAEAIRRLTLDDAERCRLGSASIPAAERFAAPAISHQYAELFGSILSHGRGVL